MIRGKFSNHIRGEKAVWTFSATVRWVRDCAETHHVNGQGIQTGQFPAAGQVLGERRCPSGACWDLPPTAWCRGIPLGSRRQQPWAAFHPGVQVSLVSDRALDTSGFYSSVHLLINLLHPCLLHLFNVRWALTRFYVSFKALRGHKYKNACLVSGCGGCRCYYTRSLRKPWLRCCTGGVCIWSTGPLRAGPWRRVQRRGNVPTLAKRWGRKFKSGR